MKNLFFILVALLAVNVSVAQEKTEFREKTDGPAMTFAETSHDFGDITQGEKVTHVFNFTNTGTKPLVLSNVQTTCGCTATNWPREPIMPNAEASITVNFNSAGKMGKQNKVVTIYSNAGQDRVKIVTNVMPKGETR